jgi:hypothetical protein
MKKLSTKKHFRHEKEWTLSVKLTKALQSFDWQQWWVDWQFQADNGVSFSLDSLEMKGKTIILKSQEVLQTFWKIHLK